MEISSNDDGFEYSRFEIRPYKFTELARIYHINVQTFKRWIRQHRRKLGKIIGHYLSIQQVEIIIAKLKLPYFVRVEISSEENFEKKLENKVGRLPEPSEKVSKRKVTKRKKPKRAVKKKRNARKRRSGRK